MQAKTLCARADAYCDERGREYFFDNAKFILIFLVVLAHAISPLRTGNDACKTIWNICNTLHMPCLIFISGYFGKKFIQKDGPKVQRPFTYAVLYLAAQISVALFEHFVLHNVVALSIFNARSSLWFLQCLFWWYLLLPLLDRFKPKYVMAGAILVGLFAGYDMKIGNFLAFTRMLNFLPFFMAGYYMQKDQIQKLFTKKNRVLGVISLVVASVGLYLLKDVGIGRIITSNYSYWDIPLLTDHGIPEVLWWGSRAWFYVFAAMLCFGFLSLAPRKKNIFTRFGSRTLAVYILHRFLYLAYLKYEWYVPFDSAWGRVIMVCIAFALTIVFSLKPCALPFEALQSIKVAKLLRSVPAQAAQPVAQAPSAAVLAEKAETTPGNDADNSAQDNT